MVCLNLPLTVLVLPQWGIFNTNVQSKHCTSVKHKSFIEARQPPLRQYLVGGMCFFVRFVWSAINFVHCLVSRGLCGREKIKTPKGRKKNKVLFSVAKSKLFCKLWSACRLCAVCKCACFFA